MWLLFFADNFAESFWFRLDKFWSRTSHIVTMKAILIKTFGLFCFSKKREIQLKINNAKRGNHIRFYEKKTTSTFQRCINDKKRSFFYEKSTDANDNMRVACVKICGFRLSIFDCGERKVDFVAYGFVYWAVLITQAEVVGFVFVFWISHIWKRYSQEMINL